jgi:hypothetical protein
MCGMYNKFGNKKPSEVILGGRKEVEPVGPRLTF